MIKQVVSLWFLAALFYDWRILKEDSLRPIFTKSWRTPISKSPSVTRAGGGGWEMRGEEGRPKALQLGTGIVERAVWRLDCWELLQGVKRLKQAVKIILRADWLYYAKHCSNKSLGFTVASLKTNAFSKSWTSFPHRRWDMRSSQNQDLVAGCNKRPARIW